MSTDLAIPGLVDAELVGSGGFGRVYRAQQPGFGRTVAVKLLDGLADDAATMRRFERECRAIGTVSGHPNVVPLYDAGTSEAGRPYLLMAYLRRGSLAQRLAAAGPMSWRETATIGVKLAGALGFAHAAGLLHRDIKPGNVLVSDYGEPLLADFGIAQFQSSAQTTTSATAGTLAHCAPELLAGGAPSEAGDVYSLASTLFSLLAGWPPFFRPGEESLLPLLARIASDPVPDLRPLGVADPVARAIEAGLAKSPQQRPPRAMLFGRLLQQAQSLTGAPVTELPMADAESDGDPPADGAGDLAAWFPALQTPVPGPVLAPRPAPAPQQLVSSAPWSAPQPLMTTPAPTPTPTPTASPKPLPTPLATPQPLFSPTASAPRPAAAGSGLPPAVRRPERAGGSLLLVWAAIAATAAVLLVSAAVALNSRDGTTSRPGFTLEAGTTPTGSSGADTPSPDEGGTPSVEPTGADPTGADPTGADPTGSGPAPLSTIVVQQSDVPDWVSEVPAVSEEDTAYCNKTMDLSSQTDRKSVAFTQPSPLKRITNDVYRLDAAAAARVVDVLVSSSTACSSWQEDTGNGPATFAIKQRKHTALGDETVSFAGTAELTSGAVKLHIYQVIDRHGGQLNVVTYGSVNPLSSSDFSFLDGLAKKLADRTVAGAGG